MPRGIAEKISSDIAAVVAQADVRTRFEDMAMEAASTSIEALHKQVRAEQFRWAGVVKSLGLNKNP